jgi:hypothetical protein
MEFFRRDCRVLHILQLRESITQTPVHESPLLERHPPFAGLSSSVSIQTLHKAGSQLLSDLREVLP